MIVTVIGITMTVSVRIIIIVIVMNRDDKIYPSIGTTYGTDTAASWSRLVDAAALKMNRRRWRRKKSWTKNKKNEVSKKEGKLVIERAKTTTNDVSPKDQNKSRDD